MPLRHEGTKDLKQSFLPLTNEEEEIGKKLPTQRLQYTPTWVPAY
jgi:hypothetical protein